MDRMTMLALAVGGLALVGVIVLFLTQGSGSGGGGAGGAGSMNLTNGTAVLNVASITTGDLSSNRVSAKGGVYLGPASTSGVAKFRSDYQLSEGIILMGGDVSEGTAASTAGQIVPYAMRGYNLGGATTNGISTGCPMGTPCLAGEFIIQAPAGAVSSSTGGPMQIMFSPIQLSS